MPKVKISEYSATANSNTDVASINIDEGCAPSGINNAIRAVMGHLKDFQQGTYGDPFNGPVNGTLGATTASTANVTTLTTSSTVTHNGGTANGVAYLNGSKVLTTGSTLYWDGTFFGVGTNGPNRKLYVQSDDSVTGGNVVGVRNSNATAGAFINFLAGGSNAPSIGSKGDDLVFNADGYNGTEWARFSSGNLLVGTTTSNSAKVTISNAGAEAIQFYPGSASNDNQTLHYNRSASVYCSNSIYAADHRFYIGGVEKARIDSSGNLLVGTTSTVAGAAFVVSKSVNDYLARFINSNATAYGVVVNYSGASPNSTGQEFLRCVDSTTDRMTVRSNGGIANFSANDVNLSDRREKTNFAPAKSYLETICAIPVQTFNYIDQNLEEDGGLTLGVVAQDVQAVAPELVMESNWAGKDEEPKMRLSIYQTDLQYALMKCIQEQQALITTLTARITALEGA